MTAVRWLTLLLLFAVGAGTARERILLDDGWSFAFATDADRGAALSPVRLPHTWNAHDGQDKKRPYRRDVGVYRRELPIDASRAGQALYLWFEGANQAAQVFVNGRPAGRHVGGYTGFAVDIGGLVTPGRRNRLEVRVDNRHDETVPPLNADFTFYGGLYRDVWLLALGPAHFAIDEFGATALDVRTVALTPTRARLEIAAGLRNASVKDRALTVAARVVDREGREVARASNALTLPAGRVAGHVLDGLTIENPDLWSPESPALYRVICTIEQDGATLDVLETTLGLRSYRLDAGTGFILNGEPYRLFGTNRHQDQAGLGNALPDELHRADLERIKADGFNFLRLAHYPQDPAVLDAADELGLVVWEEIPIVNLIGLSPAFADHAERMLREMIRQHRGHASIAFWGYMNEVTLTLPEPLPKGYYDAVVELAQRLERVAEAEDPARLTVMALSRDELGRSPAALQSVTDALAFNLYFGWYYEDFRGLGRFLDSYHQANPGRPLLVSEYGAGSDRRVHALLPQAFDFSIEYQQAFHEANFAQILERPWLSGSAVWNQFDFGSSQRQDTMFGINQKGLWTFDRQPKDVAWYYRAMLTRKPFVHIATRDWPVRAGSRAGDALMPVKIYSNVPSVRLSMNGAELGARDTANGAATWTVRFVPGVNRLEAQAAGAGDVAEVVYEDRSPLFDDGDRGVRLAINAGGGEQVVEQGVAWEADRAYVPGGWGYVGGAAERTHRRILGTGLDPLYQSRRRGRFEYRFDVADGAWCASLHTADFSDYEAMTRHETLQASNGGGLLLSFGDEATAGFVNAIELEPGDCRPMH